MNKMNNEQHIHLLSSETQFSTEPATIILVGATGDLGQRITTHLRKTGANVSALVREGSRPEAVAALAKNGVRVIEVDFSDQQQLVQACLGGACLVSALNGLEDVILDLQTKVMQAAIEARVPRFIPSDYCIDYTKLPEGSNRNLDLRRRFNQRLDESPITATSILCGMFTDLLTGQAPLVMFGPKRILYWGDKSQPLDFTTIEDNAAYTARAALDKDSPRYLRIAGDVQSAEGLRRAAGVATGKEFKFLRPGGLGGLRRMISITRFLFPQRKEIFPPWQGMQYLHNMLSGGPKLEPLDNNRYPGMVWTSVQDLLAKHLSGKQRE